jgi:hypothetical protein
LYFLCLLLTSICKILASFQDIWWSSSNACWTKLSLCSRILTDKGLPVTNCHLCIFWLLVFRCVCVCARAGLGLYAIIVFPSFFVCCDLCSGCHLLPPVFYWLQGFMCVRAQVGCSVVCNWSLCDLFVDVCILMYLGFIFCL